MFKSKLVDHYAVNTLFMCIISCAFYSCCDRSVKKTNVEINQQRRKRKREKERKRGGTGPESNRAIRFSSRTQYPLDCTCDAYIISIIFEYKRGNVWGFRENSNLFLQNTTIWNGDCFSAYLSIQTTLPMKFPSELLRWKRNQSIFLIFRLLSCPEFRHFLKLLGKRPNFVWWIISTVLVHSLNYKTVTAVDAEKMRSEVGKNGLIINSFVS